MRKLNQVGETVVEVLMSVAVLGAVIASSYVIVRRSLNTGQTANERTQATKIVESQIERLKFLATQPGNGPGQGIFGQASDFCIAQDSGGALSISTDLGVTACQTAGFPESNMEVRVTYVAAGPDTSTDHDDDQFRVVASWDSVTDGDENGRNIVEVVYRLHPVL